MLFSYTYVSHPLERLHGWIEHLVTTVWCRNGGAYSVTLLCSELQDIAAKVDQKDTNKRSIFDDIRDLDALIQALSRSKRDELATMFLESTAVDDLCHGSAAHYPYRFAELLAWDSVTAERLKEFFNDLFNKHIKSGPIKLKLGDLKKHVDAFCTANSEGVCPFCGLEETRDENYTTRDPYDHYLPRQKYPFNSVNFRNLALMCHTCNSSYKTTKDPISREPGKRQKAFAPFEPAVPFPTMTVHFEATRIQALKPQHITLKIESVTHAEEFETWEWLFGIQQRYKGKLCKKRGAYTWLNTVLTDSRNYKVTPQEVLEKIRANTAGDPFLDDGFLKLPTLDACQSAGLL